MSEAVAETVADAPHADHGRDTDCYRAPRRRFAAALMRKSRTASILRSSSPAFRILMLGSSVSMFGSRISTVAFPMLVLHLNNSPLITGLVAFAVITPSMLVYMPAGVLVDRWDPWRVMLVSEFLRGLVIASVVLSLAIRGDRVSIPFLIVAMIAEEILEIFSTLADRRYLSRLMESENMASRQAYVEVRAHAVILAGRPIGPFLFAISPLFPFLADALSFLFSVGSLMVLRKRGGLARESQRVYPRQLIGDAGKGFEWLRKDRRALLTVILMAITSLVAQALVLIFLSDAHSKKLSTLAVGVVLERHIGCDPGQREIGLRASQRVERGAGDIGVSGHGGGGAQHAVAADMIAAQANARACQPHRLGVIASDELGVGGGDGGHISLR